MILAYRVFSYLIYPLLIILIYCRKILEKEDPKRYKEKIFSSHFNVKKKRNSKLVWFHAASIGEFNSIMPIIYELNNHKNKFEFLITTTTKSSGKLAEIEIKKYKNIQHRYLPLDVSFLINNFLKSWKPNRIFLVDSEIWPNLIINANKYKIPLALINARLTEKSFNRWLKFPVTAKKIFNLFDLFLPANLETKKFLKKLNARNIYYNGNIKLINEVNFAKIKNINKKILLKSRFWMAASTHEGEDIFCLNVHSKIKKKYKDIITIIAPRHISRVHKLKSLSEKFKLNVQLLNKGDLILKNKEIVIINSFGVLKKYFKYAKSVFIGKSIIKKLKNDSGQNPMDAAKLNCKIYHGPYVNNFKEIYKILEKNNIAKKINTYEELSSNLIKDLKSPSKNNNYNLKAIDSLGRKTLSDTMKNINKFIFNDIKKT